jgi:hypothetical protein
MKEEIFQIEQIIITSGFVLTVLLKTKNDVTAKSMTSWLQTRTQVVFTISDERVSGAAFTF